MTTIQHTARASRCLHPLRIIGLLAALVLLLSIAPVAAQDADALVRDPAALAQRLLGVDDMPPIPDLPTLYDVGDSKTFFVGKRGADHPTTITATLAGVTPEIYLWVEQGVDYNPATMQQLAQLIDQLVGALRWRGTYTPSALLPATRGQVVDPTNLYPLPDVDGDPHLYIVFATDLTEERDAIVNPVDSLPTAFQPAGYGNVHETIVINTSPFVGADLSNQVFTNAIVRGVFNLVFDTHVDAQPAWLREGLAWYLLSRLQQTPVATADVADYLLAAETPLLAPSTLTTRTQTLGAELLFMAYLSQRYGDSAVLGLYGADGDGMTPLDNTFAALGTTDPISGDVVTGDDAFADFVMTNGLNGAFGDGRYVHRVAQLTRGAVANATAIPRIPATLTGAAAPYGAHYYEFQTDRATVLEFRLEDSGTVERLNLSNSDDIENRFYWSGRAPNRDHTLTRAFDLSGVDHATLTYDVWYDLAEGWNYGYVEVSSDGGQTWQVVRAPNSSTQNRYGAAYGPGYTGISNPDGPRPFPVIGVQIADDGVTIFAVEPGSPAADAGLEAGDRIAGYDSAPWPGTPNILALLAGYGPGDTLNLWIQRGNRQVDVPVVLGASPTRMVQPEPRWLEETVDLSAYAGQAIVVRFEYVSLPGRWNGGMAVDNIAVPELDFLDDAEGASDWTQAGWEIVSNAVPARFLIQIATFGAQTEPPRVRRLLGPDDAPSGTWRVPLAEGERFLLTVSGMNTDTLQPAPFTLDIGIAD